MNNIMQYFLCDEHTHKTLFIINGLIERFYIHNNETTPMMVCDCPTADQLQDLKPETFYEINFIHKKNNGSIRIYIESYEKIGSKLFINVNGHGGGIISILQQTLSSAIERPWLNMIGKRKKLYTASCLYYSGIQKEVARKSVTIEGKYITDYYAFFCEIGYGFCGKLGYMGSCLNGLTDCFCECKGYSEVTLTWHDFETAKYAIENTYPYQDNRYDVVNDIVDALSSHMTLILK